MTIANTFVTVVNMSITAAMLAVAVLLVRPLLQRLRFPRLFSYLLWVVVLFRLLCPVSFTAVFSLLGVFGSGGQVSEPVAMLDSYAVGMASSMQWADPVPLIVPTAVTVMAAVWLVGCLLMLGYGAVSLLLLRARISTAVAVGDGIYQSEQVKTPFVFGFFHPAIYLPADMGVSDNRYIIEHEKVHIKRFDNVVKIIGFTALSLHWFNPIAWLSVLMMNRDMEMSCDEQVLGEMGSDIRQKYSLLLLEMATEQVAPSMGIASFGEYDVKRRIKNVLNYKHPTMAKAVIGAAIVIVVALGLLANPMATIATATPAPTPTPPAQQYVPSAEPEQDIAPPVASSSETATEEPQPISFKWVVDGGFISAGFYGYKGHTGTDIAAHSGTEIYAAQDGVVSYAVNYSDGAYGRRVDIDHGDGWLTRYAHCSEVLVEEGAEVKQGQLIAKVGKTGNANGNQLHFEIRQDNECLNPEDYIGKKAPERTEDGYIKYTF